MVAKTWNVKTKLRKSKIIQRAMAGVTEAPTNFRQGKEERIFSIEIQFQGGKNILMRARARGVCIGFV